MHLLESFKCPNLGFLELLIERNNEMHKIKEKCIKIAESAEQKEDEITKTYDGVLTEDILDVHAEKLAII